ncbi:MAG TPA: hypothetical protein VFJ14_06725 [Nocardioidaceae bacterium]|nr:hypothetical protein [Nocardioidaceae bacterium]
MPTTTRDAQALTYLAKRLREETHGACRWDDAGIWATVSKLEGRQLADTIERVCRHAADPEAKTPGAINRPFVPEARRQPVQPPKRGQDCPHHPGQWAENCGGCAADRQGQGGYDDEPTASPPRTWETASDDMRTGALAAMRRDVELAKGWAERSEDA